MTETETYTAYRLANMADCASPDSPESAGAQFLLSVQDATREHLESDGDPDELHEIADGAPSVYTHERWQQFVDLCAYNEDPSELGQTTDDMTQAAAVCLYMIADRLANALVAAWQEGADDA